MKIFLIAGARPNFVKVAALVRAFKAFKKSHPASRFTLRLINTGQHYDFRLSKKIFQDLDIPTPAANLGVGSASHAVQTARIMVRFERLLERERPDLVMVVGDVNSTLATSLVAAKMRIPIAHVEAGLRSFDRSMPEEINRMVTDAVSDFLFTTCEEANQNLRLEGKSEKKIFFVGNVMVDTLLAHLEKAERSKIKKKFRLREPYALLTLHRPSNVDCDTDFLEIVKALEEIQKKIRIIFPVHPRTALRLKKGALSERLRRLKNLQLTPPLGYLDFIHLLKGARLVLTDSGGIQEETTALGIPCITLRDNTERPVTLTQGTNVLAGRKSRRIVRLAGAALNGFNTKRFRVPPLWDGGAADRIVRILARR